MKSCVLLTLTAAAISVQSQDVRYWLAYGDVNFASSNGRPIGSELRAGSTPMGLSAFKIRVMAERVGGSNDTFGVGGIMLGIDWASKNAGNYVNRSAFEAAQTNKIIHSELVGWGKGLPGKSNSGEFTSVDVTPTENLRYSGSAGPGTSERPIGLWLSFGFGSGKNLYLEPNKPVMLAEIFLGIDTARMASTAIWGDDPKESGLQLFGAENATSRFTYLGDPSGSGTLRAPKKYVLAIPEPASLVALGGALVAFGRRRRS